MSGRPSFWSIADAHVGSLITSTVTPLLLSLTKSIKELQQQTAFRWLSKSSKSKGRDSDHTTLNTLWLLERGTLFYKPARLGHCLPPGNVGPKTGVLPWFQWSFLEALCHATALPPPALHSGSLGPVSLFRWHSSLAHRMPVWNWAEPILSWPPPLILSSTTASTFIYLLPPVDPHFPAQHFFYFLQSLLFHPYYYKLHNMFTQNYWQ